MAVDVVARVVFFAHLLFMEDITIRCVSSPTRQNNASIHAFVVEGPRFCFVTVIIVYTSQNGCTARLSQGFSAWIRNPYE